MSIVSNSLYSKCYYYDCKKKTLTISSKCKCNNYYCKKHKFNHNCQYNYYENYKNLLKINNPQIKKQKISNI
jgi:predicted nucleic acid binding AN1-type Zn finger protein